MDKTNLDPIEVARLVAGVFLSQQLAAIVGPYAIIILAAVAGAAARLGNRKPGPGPDDPKPINPFLFFFLALLFALLLTVPVAAMVASWNEKLETQWLITPVAAFLAYVADRIPSLASSVFDAVREAVVNWITKGKKDTQ